MNIICTKKMNKILYNNNIENNIFIELIIL